MPAAASMLDLPLLGELLLALLIVATLDCPPVASGETAPPPDAGVGAAPWLAENDCHAQRILRLEARGTRVLPLA